MALLAWNDAFATGIPAVDEQHETLFRIVNDFHDGLTAGRAREEQATMRLLKENGIPPD